ncbi:ABC transporter permease [Pigmentiphaga sp. NML080357]|jgi:putative ABC transport system permease protein|uniref:Branched-chain amino acid ABC transporter permease n=1 Tax=Pigmentiphaga daeguensis TaxID=414049 RepID=A0ABP3LGX6_9BURK|nr:ABC transporter permease [Pigmentiphaga sp. NML080357]OVZ60240.1 ABC transporter permease [Pigmentiphaga sp. NML080357]
MNFLSTFLNLVPMGMMQGLIYALIAIAVMIPFRILSFADMTGEGTLAFGACVTAKCLVIGLEPVSALLIGALAGFLGGSATAYIHEKVKINTLLCGILVLSMLYSIDIRVMGQPNTALFNFPNLFAYLPGDDGSLTNRIVFLAAVDVVLIGLIFWFLGTQHGMAMRALGSSQAMARAQGINVKAYTLVGLGLANLIAALGGGLLAQNQGFADVNMGFGTLINGLASLLLGEAIIGNRTIFRQVAAPVLGSVVYFQLISLVLAFGFQPSDLKMVTALFVLVTLISLVRRKPGRSPSRAIRASSA